MPKIKLVALVLAFLVLVLPATVFGAAQAGDIVFTVGQAAYLHGADLYAMSAPPIIVNDRTYVPLRDFTQAVGLSVSWNPSNQTITVDPPAIPTQMVSNIGNIETINGINRYEYPITVSIPGYGNKGTIVGRIDTGADITTFPDSFLRSLGFTPFSGPITADIAAGTCQEYYYKIPYPVCEGLPLGKGTLTVAGIVNAQNQALIGADILTKDNFTLNNGTWTLSVPKQ